jgi:hypothetical protein
MQRTADPGPARGAAETPPVERDTWFDTCPGRGANSNKELGHDWPNSLNLSEGCGNQTWPQGICNSINTLGINAIKAPVLSMRVNLARKGNIETMLPGGGEAGVNGESGRSLLDPLDYLASGAATARPHFFSPILAM